ncbi:hypothetical protein J2S74_002979 [Evansella vedderi]|uniref:Uncharacterized protein n=1 Tax=Evansella vedderi TaxID=38282 RepID=A0ABT9ZXZ9_9BACI|nr:hypothetical protein [Evansella vedderi]MDQ0255597.1 hypothetical protein [Evansella vedderi]
MKRVIRSTLDFKVLKSLWQSVHSFVEENKEESVSFVFEKKSRALITDPKPLPIKPNRRISRRTRKEFEKEFPMIRSSLYLNPILIQELFDLYDEIAKYQYGEDEEINIHTLVTTVLYFICYDNGIKIDDNYFDEEYFNSKYTYQKDNVLESLRELSSILNKPPTQREWKVYRQRVNGPSLSYIESHFGSFNHAKDLAGLEKCKSGKKPKKKQKKSPMFSININMY